MSLRIDTVLPGPSLVARLMGQHTIVWYLLHRREAKAQTSLRICAVSPEPPLFTYIQNMEAEEDTDQLLYLQSCRIRHNGSLKQAFSHMRYEPKYPVLPLEKNKCTRIFKD